MRRLTFFPQSQRLMASSPTPAHESVLTVVKRRLTCLLDSIPVSYKVHLEVESAALISVSPGVSWTPDAIIEMWSKHNMKSRRLWLIESAFSQTDANVMEKLRGYVLAVPDLLVVCKISFKQARKYESPRLRGSTAKLLRSATLLTESEWKQRVGEEFADVVVGGHSWFSLSSVVVHVWVRPPGDLSIDIDRPVLGSYTTGVRTSDLLVFLSYEMMVFSDALSQHTT